MKNEDQVRDEIRLREASLDDARREYEAGELSDADYRTITAREDAALDQARRVLDEITLRAKNESSSQPHTPRVARTRKRSRLVVALICFALAAGVLVWANLGLRQSGSSATGGLSLSQTQKVQELLNEGQADVASANLAAALSAYQQLLVIEPTNVTALTETGWLEASAGSKSKDAALVTRGVNLLREALALAPHAPAPLLYYAIIAYQTPGNTALATKEFRLFLGQHPSNAQLAIAAPYLRLVGLAG